jgi:hypothetical protein
MRDKLSALLGISSEEGHKVSMLLTQSVFIGIFIGAFDITAYSLLLSTYDEKLMARGFVFSGLAAIILIYLYLKLRSKSDSRNFTAIILFLLLAATVSLWFAIINSTGKWIIFLVFVMLAPLNILSFLSFWNNCEKLIIGKPDKLFRFFEGGLITGIMIVSFMIPAILKFGSKTQNILLISILSIFAAAIVQLAIDKQSEFVAKSEEEYSEDIIKRLPLFVKKDHFQRSLGVFAALSVLTAFLIQYLFMAATRKQFPVSEDMAVFLGIFTGVMMIFNLFLKFIGFPFIRHHSRISQVLLFSPVIISIISIVGVILGFSLNSFAQATEGLMIIVIISGINRLVSKSFKDSVEMPSYKILYQSVSKKLRPEIQSGLDGTVNEMGLVFSGIILTGFGFLSFFGLNYFSILLAVISLIWIFLGVRLLKVHRISLRNLSDPLSPASEPQLVLNNRFTSGLEFRKDYYDIITGNYSAINKITGKYFEELSAHAISKKDINLLPALRKIAGNPECEKSLRQRSQEIIDILNKKDIEVNEGLRLLAGTRLPQTTEILKLLRNNSVETKKLAIYIIGKFRITDLLSVVCEALSNPGLAHDAYKVLLSLGDGIEDELLRYYLINSGSLKVSRIILQLLGNISTKESTGFLFSHLWSNSRQIKEISVKSLIRCNYKPDEEEIQRLENLAFEIVGIMSWNLNAEIILERQKNTFLLDKIKLENKRAETFLFNVLSLTYGAEIIGDIRRNLSEKRIESTFHALEIIRDVVSESIKPVLTIILDDIPVRKKVKWLSDYFPAEISRHNNLAEELINRDYNLISLWTKASTLRSISKIEGNEMAESVTALLFSPEEIIQEESAYLIARSNPELYSSASSRISGQVKRKLDKVVCNLSDRRGMLFEKVQFLSELFKGIPAWELFMLAGELRFVNDQDMNADGEEGSILWTLNKEKTIQDVKIVYDGAVNLKNKLTESHELSFYQLSLASVEEYQFQYPDRSKLILNYVNNIKEIS